MVENSCFRARGAALVENSCFRARGAALAARGRATPMEYRNAEFKCCNKSLLQHDCRARQCCIAARVAALVARVTAEVFVRPVGDRADRRCLGLRVEGLNLKVVRPLGDGADPRCRAFGHDSVIRATGVRPTAVPKSWRSLVAHSQHECRERWGTEGFILM